MKKPKLHILITSTRPTRNGPALGKWFNEFAKTNSSFEIELVDLAAYHLPVFDEPNHPHKQDYQFEHTKTWAAKVTEADAFVFLIPEYDYFPPASLVNAIQYLSKEWNYKPVGFLSYSIGGSAGLRAAQTAKLLVTSVKMMPMAEGVAIPFFTKFLSDSGEFIADEFIEKTSLTMLNELYKWTTALMTMRG